MSTSVTSRRRPRVLTANALRRWHATRSRRMPAALWKALADAGVLGLAMPERHGGSGGSLSDLGVFAVEAGRGLCPTLVHGTIAGRAGVDALGGPSSTPRCCRRWRPDGQAPRRRCGRPRDAALSHLRSRADPARRWLGAERQPSTSSLDADLADHVVVSAETPPRTAPWCSWCPRPARTAAASSR